MPLSAPESARPTRRRALGTGLLLGMLAVSGCATASRPTPLGLPVSEPILPTPLPERSAVAPAVMSREAAIAHFDTTPPGKFGLEVAGVQLGLPETAQAVALTFDACGGARGNGYDEPLIQSLREHRVPATLFINQRWARANHSVLRELATDPLFEIANHGSNHAPLASRGQRAYGIRGTGSVGEAYDEIIENQRYLMGEFGIQPRFFRSGTAHFDECSAALSRALGLLPMNFTVNLDAGATFDAETVSNQVQLLGANDVGIGHFNQPTGHSAAGVARGLPRLLESLARQELSAVKLCQVAQFVPL